ncbi:UDP-N-acetylmuramoyl-tripeptide--D-alanyl-D-alanine ligase [Cytobacillus depressus]|uniref:UDP-N-acetylmuramoyl-tripeptide--D-alanyl-D-alanine ligase n=1 Tax=Cytobacillus depressus TaxID=1602942 RepID=A0A6L3V2W3_9BACI|nr:UDP-N-acetylmuramoyl-tripeptide--D-alanyl-D-alanine ligase [Cytobacillus depressus]KAB2330791.1 UDP-N-acetylmuramoyl-tripeptide--D-alanyl-D-alanine ligase [Cytobacillus depressus]
MRELTLEKISKAMGCKILSWQTNQTIKGFTNNHKNPSPFSLVFLFRHNLEEDKLIQRLIKGQATGIVISRKHNFQIDKFAQAGIGVLEAGKVKQAYRNMAKLYRTQLSIPITQVIGSSGKTTTKELIGSILKQKYSTLVGAANFNAPEGVVYNLSKIEEKHEAAVLEVGMKSLGIIRISSRMIKPQIGVVTCIHRAHLTRLGTIENIIKAKAEMIEHLSPKGTLVINGDDPNCVEYLKKIKYPGKIITFGFSEGNTIRAKNVHYKNFQSFFTVKGKGFEFDCMMNTFGSYNITNALAAIAVGIELQVPHKKIQQGITEFSPVKGRLQVLSRPNNITIIHDNFNANPDSTSLLLSQIPNLPKRPIILVLGDMENPRTKEAYAKNVHYQIGEKIGGLSIDKLVAIGKWAGEYCQGAKAMGISPNKLYYYKHVDEAKKELPQLVPPNSIVILKASVAYIDLKPLIHFI